MMKRREFIGLLSSAAVAWPLAARAQQRSGIGRVGVLMRYGDDDPETKAVLAGFRQGLEKRGWQEGRNLHIDYRLGIALDQAAVLAKAAKELIVLQPDVVFCQGTSMVAALEHESRTTPIWWGIDEGGIRA